MKRNLLFILALISCSLLFAQNFPGHDFEEKKHLVILTNPTVKNIKTIEYLVNNKLLKVNTRKVHFVGVYSEDQKYDFNQTIHFLDSVDLDGFSLHEIRGELNTSNLFGMNNITHKLQSIFDHSAGVFFFGGPDIPPAVYGEENTGSIVADPERHFFETTFLFHLLGSSRNPEFVPFLEKNPDFFVTGFCLGMQTINVATGGTMIQDIPSEVYGTTSPESAVKTKRDKLHCNFWHKISDDTLLMGINLHPIHFSPYPFFKKKVKANNSFNPKIYSSHHQAIEKVGKDLEVTAVSPDGKIIEAIAHSRYPNVFAVQFHPEIPALYEDMEQWKFHPQDPPATYHDLIGKKSVRFHKKYWKFVSKALKDAVRAKN